MLKNSFAYIIGIIQLHFSDICFLLLLFSRLSYGKDKGIHHYTFYR